MAKGAGPIRIVFISNWILAFIWFFVFFQNPSLPRGEWFWAPFAGGMARVCGGGFLFTALRIGDVSVQAPMGGVKVMFVALFSLLMGTEPLCYAHFGAAFLTVVSVYLLGRSGHSGVHNKRLLARAIVLSLIAAVFFALNDVLAVKAAHHVGVDTYMAYNFFTSALGSLAFIPFFNARIRDMPKASLPWALGGSFLLAIDVACLLYSISEFREATTANVLYSARGIWAILLVWLVGSWFHNEEGKKGTAVMLQRLLGASMLFGAIIWVLIHH